MKRFTAILLCSFLAACGGGGSDSVPSGDTSGENNTGDSSGNDTDPGGAGGNTSAATTEWSTPHTLTLERRLLKDFTLHTVGEETMAIWVKEQTDIAGEPYDLFIASHTPKGGWNATQSLASFAQNERLFQKPLKVSSKESGQALVTGSENNLALRDALGNWQNFQTPEVCCKGIPFPIVDVDFHFLDIDGLGRFRAQTLTHTTITSVGAVTETQLSNPFFEIIPEAEFALVAGLLMDENRVIHAIGLSSHQELQEPRPGDTPVRYSQSKVWHAEYDGMAWSTPNLIHTSGWIYGSSYPLHYSDIPSSTRFYSAMHKNGSIALAWDEYYAADHADREAQSRFMIQRYHSGTWEAPIVALAPIPTQTRESGTTTKDHFDTTALAITAAGEITALTQRVLEISGADPLYVESYTLLPDTQDTVRTEHLEVREDKGLLSHLAINDTGDRIVSTTISNYRYEIQRVHRYRAGAGWEHTNNLSGLRNYEARENHSLSLTEKGTGVFFGYERDDDFNFFVAVSPAQ